MDAFPSLLKGRLRTVLTAVGIFWLGLAAPQRALGDPCPPEGDPPSFCYVWDDTEGVCAWVPGPPTEPPPGPCLDWDATICDWVSQETPCSTPGEFWYAGTLANPVCACGPCEQIPQPPSPGPCYAINPETCQWELPQQPGGCWQWHGAPQCAWVEIEPPVQTSDCQVWNEGNCSWDLPPQPGPCWNWEEGDCLWIEPLGQPEGCWTPEGECGWVQMDETCTGSQVWNSVTCQCECDPGPGEEPEGCYHLSEDGCSWEPDTECDPGYVLDEDCGCVLCDPGLPPGDLTCPVLSGDGCSWEEKGCSEGEELEDCECVDCEPTEPEPPCSVWNPTSCGWDEMEPPCGPDEIRDASCACVPGCPGPSGEQPPCTEWSQEACDWITIEPPTGCEACEYWDEIDCQCYGLPDDPCNPCEL